MEKFDLDRAIDGWKKQLWKQQGLEPGYIEELECNLRDRIDDYISDGHSEKEAFELAKHKSLDSPESLADEYFKVTSKKRTPPWKSRFSFLSLLPLNFRSGYRHLVKRKLYSAINVFGLAVSISVVFLLWLYVDDQYSFDRHVQNANRVYRVNYDLQFDGQQTIYSNVGVPIATSLKSEFPEIEEVARLYGMGGLQVHTGALIAQDVRIESTKIFYAEASFLKVFKLDFIAGNPSTALDEENSIVISASMANKLFGSTDVLGNTIQIGGSPRGMLRITGVIKDNGKTHLPLEALIAFTLPNQIENDRWLGGHVYTYVLLNEHNDIEGLRNKIPAYREKYLNDFFKERGGLADVLFQPMSSIYLDEEYMWEPYPHGSRTSTNVLALLILLLLGIACANYINLATSRSVEYAGEVGIRKVLGSSQGLLVFQFICEPILIAAIAGLLAILISLALVPIFNDLSGLQVATLSVLSLTNVSKIMLLAIAVGLVAGIYPAFYLISYKPVNILKGKLTTGGKGEKLRQVLVIFQYAMSSFLIIGVVIVAAQTRYIVHKEIGFEKENVITLNVHDVDSSGNKLRGFMNRIKSLSYVTGCTSSYNTLSAQPNAADPVFLKADGTEILTAMNRIDVGFDFFETMGIPIVDGRGFENQFGQNEYQSILINQAAVDGYGWQGYATKLNQKWHGEENGSANNVIGVVSNFSIGPSHQSIRPLIIFLNQWEVNQVFLRIEGDHMKEHLVELESLWDDFFPNHNFDFTFLNDDLNTLYQKEEQFLGLLSAIWVVIMLVTSLGIIGLISFNAELKRKEIAVRKINGASINAIIYLLSRKFVFLLLVGNLVAMPVAYYLMNQWLSNYDQRIDIGLWPFLFSLLLGLIFTALTLFYHAVKAARVNPVESLRYE